MTPMERAVIEAMAAHNHPHRADDPPYPWSMLPIARAAIGAVGAHMMNTVDPELQAALALCEHIRFRPDCERCEIRRDAATAHLARMAAKALGIDPLGEGR